MSSVNPYERRHSSRTDAKKRRWTPCSSRISGAMSSPTSPSGRDRDRTAYAAAAIPDGSVTAAKLHKNAVTSNKIKDGSIKRRTSRSRPSAEQARWLPPRRRAVPDIVSVAPYDFSLPNKGRTTVTVFVPCAHRRSAAAVAATGPSFGLYIDNVPIANTQAYCAGGGQCPVHPADGDTLLSPGGAHTGRLGITCQGHLGARPLTAPGAKSWTIIQAD